MIEAYENEDTRQNHLSPGVVANDENVLFVLVDPLQWQHDTFTTSAFRTTWLKDCQQSVVRHPYSSERRLRKYVADPLVNRDPTSRTLVGVVSSLAKKIRGITIDDSQTRAFVIVDDAIRHPEGIDYAHAVLGFTPELRAMTKNHHVAAVGNLKEVFLEAGGPRPIEKCFLPWPFWLLTARQAKLTVHRMRLAVQEKKPLARKPGSVRDAGERSPD